MFSGISRQTSLAAAVLAGILAISPALSLGAASFEIPDDALLPDMRTVVPQHVQVVNEHQRELIRFSNGVANTGAGDWRMRPEFPLDESTGTQDAIQELLDAAGNVAAQLPVSQFAYHPTHHHWHIDGIALFEVRAGSPSGPVVGDNSIKTTFCLIDWYKLEGNSPTKERKYFDCFGEHQGIQPGWVDQYHQATDGQALDITDVPVGRYYLVSTANADGVFIESDYGNNAAWVGFDLSRDSKGNPKITIVDHSDCAPGTGLCGEDAPNR